MFVRGYTVCFWWVTPQGAFRCARGITHPLCGGDTSISTCSTPAKARRTMARLSLALLALRSIIVALCSLLSSLLLDAAVECAGHSSPSGLLVGQLPAQITGPFVNGSRTTAPADATCRTGSCFHSVPFVSKSVLKENCLILLMKTSQSFVKGRESSIVEQTPAWWHV